jgi:hypothetical protein
VHVQLFEQLPDRFRLSQDVEGEIGVALGVAVADDELDVLADAFGVKVGFVLPVLVGLNLPVSSLSRSRRPRP